MKPLDVCIVRIHSYKLTWNWINIFLFARDITRPKIFPLLENENGFRRLCFHIWSNFLGKLTVSLRWEKDFQMCPAQPTTKSLLGEGRRFVDSHRQDFVPLLLADGRELQPSVMTLSSRVTFWGKSAAHHDFLRTNFWFYEDISIWEPNRTPESVIPRQMVQVRSFKCSEVRQRIGFFHVNWKIYP